MAKETKPANSTREFAIQVVSTLREAGFQALWAGGCVRDLLLGKTPKDYDVATDARPEQVQKLFRRTLAIGASFGVIQVMGGPGLDVEVATFRSDGTYSDGRHPDHVTFSSAEEDARRRDFTINGMFFDPLREEILDFVGGKQDLQERIVRAIGEPQKRFDEDKLRMLRAIRFAAILDFALDPGTEQAIHHMAGQIHCVSAERIAAELQRMLSDPHRLHAVRLLHRTGLLCEIVPPIAQCLEDADTRSTVEQVIDFWKRPVSFPLAMAGLLCGFDADAAAKVADDLFRQLRCSNDERERAIFLCQHRDSLRRAATRSMAHLKRLFAHPGRDELIDLLEATESLSGATPDADYCRALLEKWSEQDINPEPLITGNDLIAQGLPPGPEFRILLERIRDAQLNLEITTRAEALEMLHKITSKS